MKILTTKQMQEADQFTISNEPIASIDLMERAAAKCTEWIVKHFSNKKHFHIFVGAGNNGGDGLAIARQLANIEYNATVYIPHISDTFSQDFSINLERLKKNTAIKIVYLNSEKDFPTFQKHHIIIDALFGSGLTRILTDFSQKMVHFINEAKVKIISIDIPSGLFGEDNSLIHNNLEKNNPAIRANYTLTFETPFLSFFFAENEDFVGKFFILPINLNTNSLETNNFFVQKKDLANILKKRKKFSHKGDFGNALLIAGSFGKMGAAILSTNACLRSGIGLLTAHIPRCGYEVLQISSTETMLSVDSHNEIFTILPDISKFSNIAIGPGLGKATETVKVFAELLEKYQKPMIIDADALNILSENPELLLKLPKNSILTPHPKEFERLVGKTKNHFHRYELLVEFAKKYEVFVILKGAFSCLVSPQGKCFFNSTGNPGMATAGSGDVLTGILLGLLSQGYSSQETALLGTFLHGLSGDFAAKTNGENSLIAKDLIEFLPNAFLEFEK